MSLKMQRAARRAPPHRIRYAATFSQPPSPSSSSGILKARTRCPGMLSGRSNSSILCYSSRLVEADHLLGALGTHAIRTLPIAVRITIWRTYGSSNRAAVVTINSACCALGFAVRVDTLVAARLRRFGSITHTVFVQTSLAPLVDPAE